MNQQTDMRNDDEISLVDLYRILARNKTTLFGTWVLFVLSSVVYILTANNVYESSALLFPPNKEELIITNTATPELEQHTPDNVFSRFKTEFILDKYWTTFVKQHKDYFPDKNTSTTAQVYNNPFKLEKRKDISIDHTRLVYHSGDHANANKILSDYIEYVKNQLVAAVIKQNKKRLEQTIKNTQEKIENLRQLENIKVKDEMARLNSALEMARKLKITENVFQKNSKNTSLTVITDSNIPLYMRGVPVLEAELDALKSRKSNDPYIDKLRELQTKIDRLGKVQFTPEKFSPFTLVDSVQMSEHPVKPKRNLILALALVSGGFLGVFAVFFFEFIQKARNSNPSN